MNFSYFDFLLFLKFKDNIYILRKCKFSSIDFHEHLHVCKISCIVTSLIQNIFLITDYNDVVDSVLFLILKYCFLTISQTKERQDCLSWWEKYLLETNAAQRTDSSTLYCQRPDLGEALYVVQVFYLSPVKAWQPRMRPNMGLLTLKEFLYIWYINC